MDKLDCVVIGAGVIGLAMARALALARREVVVLEADEAIGTGASSRNSEVIHAGIYYSPGSLKARLCVAGRHALYRYCEAHGIPHRRCGKLIVATRDAEIPELERLKRQAVANGVTDLRPLSASEARELEPRVRSAAALLSPSTGIIDSHAYLLALQGEAESRGATVVLRTPVEGGRARERDIELRIGGAGATTVTAQCVVNAAGLHAQEVACGIVGVPPDSVPPCHLAKGNYFLLRGRSPFQRLIYPIPEAAGLGVHVTLDLAGQVRFGPDVEWISAIDYRVDPGRAHAFYAAIRAYWPDLPDESLVPGYAGIRPKMQGPGEPALDFLIQGEREHGVAGLVNLYGIESPGLTASLAIADYATNLINGSTTQ
jgi:L-2-hydroxyglutarate oxidase LhgO